MIYLDDVNAVQPIIDRIVQINHGNEEKISAALSGLLVYTILQHYPDSTFEWICLSEILSMYSYNR